MAFKWKVGINFRSPILRSDIFCAIIYLNLLGASCGFFCLMTAISSTWKKWFWANIPHYLGTLFEVRFYLSCLPQYRQIVQLQDSRVRVVHVSLSPMVSAHTALHLFASYQFVSPGGHSTIRISSKLSTGMGIVFSTLNYAIAFHYIINPFRWYVWTWSPSTDRNRALSGQGAFWGMNTTNWTRRWRWCFHHIFHFCALTVWSSGSCRMTVIHVKCGFDGLWRRGLLPYSAAPSKLFYLACSENILRARFKCPKKNGTI